MRKIIIVTIIAFAFSMFSLSGCKKDTELKYSSLWGMKWVTGNVVQSGKEVMWFQLFDQADEKDKKKAIKHYENSKDKIAGKYPASISDSSIWTLINKRIEIRLIASSKSKAYKNKEKLKQFLMKFDIDGLAKITGDKKKPKELMKYCPKLKKIKKKK